MLIRAKLLIVLACIIFSIYSGFKYWGKWRKFKKENPPASQVASVVALPVVSVPQELPSVASAPSDGEMVRCDSWGTNTGEIWGYGDGLMFRGFPDDWKSGRPVFERWRGEPL